MDFRKPSLLGLRNQIAFIEIGHRVGIGRLKAQIDCLHLFRKVNDRGDIITAKLVWPLGKRKAVDRLEDG